MKTWDNEEISDSEADRVLKMVNSATATPFSLQKLMDNINTTKPPMSEYWDVRISKVSAKNLNKWDNSKFTDGNHNGKVLQIKKAQN